MANTGALYPTTTASVNVAGSSWSWGNVERITADDGSESWITSSGLDIDVYSYAMHGSHFNAAVPVDATVNGIVLEVETRVPAGSVKDTTVQLSKDGTNLVGSNLATNANLPAATTVNTYGGVADLWGTTWTPAEVNADTFLARFRIRGTANDSDVYVDFMRVTIYYTEAGAGGAARSQVVMIG